MSSSLPVRSRTVPHNAAKVRDLPPALLFGRPLRKDRQALDPLLLQLVAGPHIARTPCPPHTHQRSTPLHSLLMVHRFEKVHPRPRPFSRRLLSLKIRY